MSLDTTDRRILTALQKRGRMSNAELSEAVHLSPSACHRRVQRLEADGVLPLESAWKLVSENAARACGLTDRGTLAPGQRGDVVALARTETGLSVQAVFRGGQPVMVLDGARIS